MTHWTDVDHGGHFAAMEQPEILVNDIQAFFGDSAKRQTLDPPGETRKISSFL